MESSEDGKVNTHRQLFMTALHRNDVEVVRKVLASVAINVDALLDNGRTPLVQAIANGNPEMVNLLLDRKADAEKPCPGIVQASWGDVKTTPLVYPLQQAMKTANGAILYKLLQVGTDLHKSGCSVIDVLQSVIKNVKDLDDLLDLLLAKLEKESISVSKYKNQLSLLLVTAVNQCNHSLVGVLLNKGANPNHRLQGSDLPVLVLAAEGGDIDICNSLVEAGAVLNHLSYIEDVRPLTAAVEAGMSNAVGTLIQIGAQVNVCSHLHIQKVSVLHIAVARRNIPIIKLLLNAGAQIKTMGNQQVSPLHIACQDTSDREDVMNLLLAKLEHGAPILNAKNTRNQTALLLACQNKSLECAKLLITKGADVDTVDTNGDSALLHAIRTCSDVCVQMLIEGGAKVNSGRCIGCTPLLTAIWNGDFTISELLIEAGADVRATKDGNHESGLHLAIAAQEDNILELLLETGKLDLDCRTDSGDTPLMLAARSGSESACELLTQYGANLDLTDHNQKETSLSLSIYFGKEDNACWLIKEGANVNIGDQSGLTPIYWAFFNCRVKALTLLLLAGASLNQHQFHNAYPRTLSIMNNEALVAWIEDFLQTPRKLQDICRLSIRKIFCCMCAGRSVTGHIDKLPLPERLRDYLAFRRSDDVQDFSNLPPNSDGVSVNDP